MRPGKKAASKTPMADYDDGCRVTSISTSSPIKTSRRSSSPPISRPVNASASRHRSRSSSPNLEKTSKSASLDAVALRSGIQAEQPAKPPGGTDASFGSLESHASNDAGDAYGSRGYPVCGHPQAPK